MPEYFREIQSALLGHLQFGRAVTGDRERVLCSRNPHPERSHPRGEQPIAPHACITVIFARAELSLMEDLA